MAICKDCGREMTTASGCTFERFDGFKDGRIRQRVRYGNETRFGNHAHDGLRCHDCGVLHGEYHHPGCDVEECPLCRRQAIGCDC